MQKWCIFMHEVFHRFFHRLWVFNRFSTEFSTGLVNSCLPTIGKIWKNLAQFWTVRILTILQGLCKSLHFQPGYFPFSGGRRRASTVHVDVLPPLHFISAPSPYTNNSHFTLPPTSPIPSLHPTFNSSPSQFPFRCAILALPSSSPPSHSFLASRLYSIHSYLTPSVGVFFYFVPPPFSPDRSSFLSGSLWYAPVSLWFCRVLLLSPVYTVLQALTGFLGRFFRLA